MQGNCPKPSLSLKTLVSTPLRGISELQVTGLTTGTAAVFTRELIQEADVLLGVLSQLKITSPLFPSNVVFLQPPKTNRFESFAR